MSDNLQHDEQNDEPLSYTPASPIKRTMAWIGVVYMVIVVALTTYFYSTGSMLSNLAPILSIPALVGAGALMVIRYRTDGVPAKGVAYGIAALCWVLALCSLPLGIVGLMSNFGG